MEVRPQKQIPGEDIDQVDIVGIKELLDQIDADTLEETDPIWGFTPRQMGHATPQHCRK